MTARNKGVFFELTPKEREVLDGLAGVKLEDGKQRGISNTLRLGLIRLMDEEWPIRDAEIFITRRGGRRYEGGRKSKQKPKE